jgi:hypothetical protein
MATGYNVRVGDADRDAIAAQLREHYADGRLTLDELNERLDQTFAAKTKADLNTVMRDLPHTAWQGQAWPGQPWQGQAWQAPMATRPTGDYRDGYGGQGARRGHRGPFAAVAPLMGLVFVILGAVSLFGMGGDRPLFVVLFIAALALFRRLFGFGRRRGAGGSRGPRGPRGPRRRR